MLLSSPEYDDLVAAHSLVVLDQELAGHELCGVHDVQQLAARYILLLQVFTARHQDRNPGDLFPGQ